MSIVYCERCDQYVDLDYNSDMILEKGGNFYAHYDCLTDNEADYIDDTGENNLENYKEKHNG